MKKTNLKLLAQVAIYEHELSLKDIEEYKQKYIVNFHNNIVYIKFPIPPSYAFLIKNTQSYLGLKKTAEKMFDVYTPQDILKYKDRYIKSLSRQFTR